MCAYSVILEVLDFHNYRTIPQIHGSLVDERKVDFSLFIIYQLLKIHEREGDVTSKKFEIPPDSHRTTKPIGYKLTGTGLRLRLENRRAEGDLDGTLVPAEYTAIR